MSKIQPPKNFKYAHLFGDRTPAINVVFSKYPLNDIPIIGIAKSKCMIVDLIVAVENIEIAKNIKKAYELNKHFQDNWAMKLPMESMLGFDGKVIQVQCKICAWIKGKDELLVPKLDSLWKDVGHYKALVAMPRVNVGDHYFLKTNSHVANEKFYFLKRIWKNVIINNSCYNSSWHENNCAICFDIPLV